MALADRLGGQQWLCLLMGCGIIDHHKDPAPVARVGGQHRGIQSGPVLRLRRNVLAGDG